ncbi:MAG: outer membrane lipoprotein carrier protein LolA [Candidatus Aureabacteria bacterium]|nr:outer membrane lipoprotein carrier protein LolA [Candidatus Auribacterota bacterium]
MRRKLLLAVMSAMPLIALCGLPAQAENPDTDAVLRKMEDEGKQLSSLQAGFRQVRFYSLFDEKKESSGTIYYKKPGMMLWKYNPPDSTELYLKGRSALMYLPDIKQVQKISLARDRKTESLLIGFGNTAEEIKRNFTVNASPGSGGNYSLDLIPKSEDLSSQFQKLRLTIDGKRWIPLQSERFEQGGDRTVFTFSDVKINASIKDTLFDFVPPKGVEVVEY